VVLDATRRKGIKPLRAELAPKLEASREAPHAVATSVRHAEEATGMWLPGGLFISGTPDKLLGGRWMMPPGH